MSVMKDAASNIITNPVSFLLHMPVTVCEEIALPSIAGGDGGIRTPVLPAFISKGLQQYI